MRWNDLTMNERADLIGLFLDNGVSSLKEMRHIYDGTKDTETEGGYTKKSLNKRERIHSLYDPAGGFGLSQIFYLGNNRSRGEEDQYYRAYLGLENSIPRMQESSKTEWDDEIEEAKLNSGELPSDFYGTTDRMDQHIQVIADTLNTGNILRNYDEYKEKYPELPSEGTIRHFYETGKEVLNNPGKWTQVKEGPQFIIRDELENNELAPLGMLADFGMKWVPEENALYVHDTYDFPAFWRYMSGMPQRPKEMKIRGRIEFNPETGSYLLREDMANYYNGDTGISKK